MKKAVFLSLMVSFFAIGGCASTDEAGGDKSAKSESTKSARHCERTDTRIQRGC